MGRALFERSKLPSQPGPHHRSSEPAVSSQLPRRIEPYVPSSRTDLSSSGSDTSCTARRPANRSPAPLSVPPISASSRGVSSKVRSTTGFAAAETCPVTRNASRRNIDSRPCTRPIAASWPAERCARSLTFSSDHAMSADGIGHEVSTTSMTPESTRYWISLRSALSPASSHASALTFVANNRKNARSAACRVIPDLIEAL